MNTRYGAYGDLGSGGTDIASSVITGAMGITSAALNFASGNKALQAQLALTVSNEKIAAEQTKQTKIAAKAATDAAEAQVRAAQVAASKPSAAPAIIVGVVGGLAVLGMIAYLLIPTSTARRNPLRLSVMP